MLFAFPLLLLTWLIPLLVAYSYYSLIQGIMESSPLKVVIVGGSITGLTLAHCLLRNGIDFVLLESRDEICPQEGAALGMLPNGSRILDQLGIFDDLIEGVQPLRKCWFWSGEGKLIAEDDGPLELEKR
jgi:2-polyprenyl-6-methoxyphenol hydroxylase and related FAD-dependent oxidoreductases